MDINLVKLLFKFNLQIYNYILIHLQNSKFIYHLSVIIQLIILNKFTSLPQDVPFNHCTYKWICQTIFIYQNYPSIHSSSKTPQSLFFRMYSMSDI